MQLTKIDRMEHIEEILMDKIEQTERNIASLKSMPDPEICQLRRMYLMDLDEMRGHLSTLRQKIDLEYVRTAEREKYGNEGGRIMSDEARKHNEAGRINQSAGMEPCHEKNHERRAKEPGGRGRDGERVHHVGPDGREVQGDPAADGRRRTRVARWQIEIMAKGQTEERMP